MLLAKTIRLVNSLAYSCLLPLVSKQVRGVEGFGTSGAFNVNVDVYSELESKRRDIFEGIEEYFVDLLCHDIMLLAFSWNVQ